MANKVYGGTPKTQQSLCLTCRAAWHMKTVNLGQIIICRATSDWRRFITESEEFEKSLIWKIV